MNRILPTAREGNRIVEYDKRMPPPPFDKNGKFRTQNQLCSFPNDRNCDREGGHERRKRQCIIPRENRMSRSSNTMPCSSSTEYYPTSAININESSHGQMRRRQRQIGVRDLQAAIKYGVRKPARRCQKTGNSRSKFKYNGITYIVDDVTKVEVTSYEDCRKLELKKIDKVAQKRHKAAKEKIQKDKSCWKTNTIIIVDTSGSMKYSDVRGSRTRLGAVWLSIAEDFVLQQIRTNDAGELDVVSIILMGESAEILIKEWPTDYVLYNEIVKHYQNPKLHPPRGHGCYSPSIKLCEEMLSVNDSSSCALALLILSDGRPSDYYCMKMTEENATNYLVNTIEDVASKFGRRLTVTTIGIGSADKFSMLESFANSASNYGSIGNFHLPSASCSSLGAAVSSVVTSLTVSQCELTEVGSNGLVRKLQRKVRDVRRENHKLIPALTEEVDPSEFFIYMNDNVEHMVFDRETSKMKKSSLQHKDARGVAFKKTAFGEGSERLAHQFFEVAADGKTVVGGPLVAKESRFICENSGWEDRDDFAKQFCKVQQTARKIAIEFNDKLDKVNNLDPTTARVSFLDCSIYYLNDGNRGEYAVVVESRLDQKFQKWNNNNGWKRRNVITLDSIPENYGIDERTNEVLSSWQHEFDSRVGTIHASNDEVAQAFSHFSHVNSGRKLLICDLQGVFDKFNSMFRFTDPVIHFRSTKDSSKKGIFGRTDKGAEGIQNFFRTHECNVICELVTKGFRCTHRRCKSFEKNATSNSSKDVIEIID